ncbi:cystathionine beta-lyase [Gluconacetobacter azotocaptans DSM 13594]|nr:cystathionine beta-lyase [Gluconacetobacter azotocaptans DSM 13594]
MTFDRDTLHRKVSRGWREMATLLVQVARDQPTDQAGVLVNPAVTRGSTVLFPTVDAMQRNGQRRYDHEMIYGAMGTPIQHQLETAIAAIEGARHTQIVSSGLAACTTPLLAFLSKNGHCLIPDSVYGPTRRFANTVLRRFGVETTYYPPTIDAAGLHAAMRPNTQIVFTESPGSHTFEVQDIRMIADVAHEHGARVMLDNTWGIGVFQPFRHGVDISIQALTKYPSGHSDTIVGAVSVADEQDWHVLRDTCIQIGQLAGPDDCWLTLRGLRTMGARLEKQSCAAIDIALWLAERPEVSRVLHPALPSCPGHALWERDFTGASALFGVVFKPEYGVADMTAMIDSLTMFGLGASWGGYESLVLPTTHGITRSCPAPADDGPALRLHIGLENPNDLIADLSAGLDVLSRRTMPQD